MVATTFSSITGARPLTSQHMSDELNDGIQDPELEQPTPAEVEPATSQADDPAVLKQQIADLEEKNKQLYARVKKSEPKAQVKEDLPTNSPYATKEDVERIALEAKGYNKDEVETLMRYGGLKALDEDIIVKGIEAGRKAKKSVDATPSGTAKSPILQKYTEDDLKRMPIDELEKIIPQ